MSTKIKRISVSKLRFAEAINAYMYSTKKIKSISKTRFAEMIVAYWRFNDLYCEYEVDDDFLDFDDGKEDTEPNKDKRLVKYYGDCDFHISIPYFKNQDPESFKQSVNYILREKLVEEDIQKYIEAESNDDCSHVEILHKYT